MTDELEKHAVDPARLSDGEWCHRAQKTIGQGDIAASYSADRIAMNQPLRKPFTWKGAQWVCVERTFRNGCQSAEVYRLADPRVFDGEPLPLTYAAKTLDGDAARSDPNGFYHGMIVRHRGQSFVLCGPPEILVPGATGQLDLFGGS